MGLTDRHAVIGFPRWTAKVTIGGGAFDAGYPGANMTVLPLSRVARFASLDPADTWLLATLDRPRPVRMLALVRHNLWRDATMRLRIYEDVEATILAHDSTFDVWPTVYPPAQMDWENDNWWDGKYTSEEMEGYTWTRPVWLDSVYMAGALRIDLVDTANPMGCIDIGLLEVAQGWQVSTNYDYGAEYGWDFRTTLQRALGGADYPDRQPKGRVFRCRIQGLPRDEALARAFEHQRQCDLDVPFLWWPDPGEPLHWLRTVMLARNLPAGLMAYAFPGHDTVPFAFQEVID